MTSTDATQFKVTYTSASSDLGEFHRLFDEGLAWAREHMGREHPLHINGEAHRSELPPIVDTSPIDTTQILGRFAAATPAHVDLAVRAARAAQKPWAALPWQQRLTILRAAATEIRRRKWQIGAVMSLEVGKSRMEAMGDAEESADLIDYYADIVAQHDGFSRPLGRLSPNENTRDVLRPFGVFACIAPFNFPMALSTGMSSAALMTGNAVVYKPAQDAPWTGLLLHECYMAAGVPAGVFHFVSGTGGQIGDAMWRHPLVDGVVFTGSKEVGMRMLREFSTAFPKPTLMELGGKNPTYVAATADLDMAAEGVARSAFGLQGQKCSACSRVYVHADVAEAFTARLLEKTRALVIGDPSAKDVYFGPVINARAVATFTGAVASARDGGEILLGGDRLAAGDLARGHYVAPTIARLPLQHELFSRELFVPFLALGVVDGIEQALHESNRVEYGLTAGIFSGSREEIEHWFDHVESGVCYANRRSGATTGAWPGVQSFTGWKGSGSTGKGGCGPYYVQQFMREQSRTVME